MQSQGCTDQPPMGRALILLMAYSSGTGTNVPGWICRLYTRPESSARSAVTSQSILYVLTSQSRTTPAVIQVHLEHIREGIDQQQCRSDGHNLPALRIHGHNDHNTTHCTIGCLQIAEWLAGCATVGSSSSQPQLGLTLFQSEHGLKKQFTKKIFF